MLKRLYLANGTLVTPLAKSDEDITVDIATGVILQTLLGYGDHCYLTLIDGDKLEVIKVRKDYSGLHVDRAQDNTQLQSFSIGASIVYKLTSAEIVDAAQPLDWNIYANGYGVAKVTGSYGSWAVHLDPPEMETIGSIGSYTTDYNEVFLVDKSGAFGCCDGGVTGAALIPGPFFYLTSMLYPQEVVEIMTPNPKDKNGNAIPPMSFGAGDWWLLTQPFLFEAYIGTSMVLGDMQLYGGQKTYSLAEQYLNPSATIGDMQLYGGQKAYTIPSDDYLHPDAYILEMFLFGGAVDYSNYLDAYLSPTIAIGDMTLS